MITFYIQEIKDLVKSWLAISVAFGIVLAGGLFRTAFISTFIIAIGTVGVGFILHELGHKFLAQKYGLRAIFRCDDKMLIIAVLVSFLGFVFAAPGAVMIQGRIDKKRFGHVALAGPAMNVALALVFLGLMIVWTDSALLSYGAVINAWLALFNMIPFGMFDGKKIMNWSKPVYFASLLLAVGLVAFTSV